MTADVDELIQAMCHSPTGCAFLLTVEENDLGPDVAADLHVAMNVSAVAIDAIDMWLDDFPERVRVALENGPRLMPLAREILAQPAARTGLPQWIGRRNGSSWVTKGT